MERMDPRTVAMINNALFFRSGASRGPAREIKPWQYVLMEYERFHLVPPPFIPPFETIEDAQIWMCLDSRYNAMLRESQTGEYRAAV